MEKHASIIDKFLMENRLPFYGPERAILERYEKMRNEEIAQRCQDALDSVQPMIDSFSSLPARIMEIFD